MAHTKAGGKTSQKKNRPGRRLGVKIFAGQKVKPGMIIVRQVGTLLHPGNGVEMGRDFTIFSMREGTVIFRQAQGKKVVCVV